MPARKNFTDARRLRIARYSKDNSVIATGERFGVHQQMVIRYRKRFGVTERSPKPGYEKTEWWYATTLATVNPALMIFV